jgi:hypothetical protein
MHTATLFLSLSRFFFLIYFFARVSICYVLCVCTLYGESVKVAMCLKDRLSFSFSFSLDHFLFAVLDYRSKLEDMLEQ